MSDDALDALRREIAETKEKANRALEAVQARSAAERFVAAHPEFDATPSNAKTLVDEMQERNLDLTDEKNYADVFADLVAKGKLAVAPPDEEQLAPKAAAAETKTGKAKLSAADREFMAGVERMGAAEYRRNLQNPEFAARVNKLFPATPVGS